MSSGEEVWHLQKYFFPNPKPLDASEKGEGYYCYDSSGTSKMH